MANCLEWSPLRSVSLSYGVLPKRNNHQSLDHSYGHRKRDENPPVSSPLAVCRENNAYGVKACKYQLKLNYSQATGSCEGAHIGVNMVQNQSCGLISSQGGTWQKKPTPNIPDCPLAYSEGQRGTWRLEKQGDSMRCDGGPRW